MKNKVRKHKSLKTSRNIISEKVLKDMKKKRAKFRAIAQQMRKNKRIPREAMQRKVRK